ncbi:MAG: hypothetical protein Kapaf2KO_17540 [Candidatus Kapaibacteriales bacterium]
MSKLHAIVATFKTPDQIMKAAETVSDAGYKNYDVHTPYPVHGMDDAMKLRPSKIGYFTIAVGFTFMSLFLFFIYWINTIDYPQVIGGKPFFFLPAYVPVLFEITILTGAVLSVAMMIVVLFKFPNNAHPLHDTNYMKQISSDTFGIAIEARDEKYNETEIVKMFESLGAATIEKIYLDPEEVNYRPPLFDKKFVGGLAVLAIFTSFSVYMHMNKLLYLPPFDWMMEQPRYDAQEPSDFFANGAAMVDPVSGTVPRGYMPYKYKGDPAGSSALTNPFIADSANLAQGKIKYDIYCSMCHGYNADGQMRLTDAYIGNPPSLHSNKVKEWSDGEIYHVITDGQNIMQSYAGQIDPEDRWAIVNYIRALQRAFDAKESDLQ